MSSKAKLINGTGLDEGAEKKHEGTQKCFPVQFIQSGDDVSIAALDQNSAEAQMMSNTGQMEYNAASLVLTQVTRAQVWRKDANSCSGVAGMLAGLDPQDPLEGLLCAQMVIAHNLATEFSRRALVSENTEHIDQNVNRATKLMNAFTRQVEALNKHRTKGQQQIIVKHQQVNVAPGGQAVVGDINQGGGRYGYDLR
jgi:hypothetical protein